MSNDYFGKWTDFQNIGNIAVMHIENDRGYLIGLKIFDNNKRTKESGIINKMEELFEKNKGKQVKVIGYEGSAGEYNGKLKPSELVFVNLVVDESEPEKVINRDIEEDDSGDLLF